MTEKFNIVCDDLKLALGMSFLDFLKTVRWYWGGVFRKWMFDPPFNVYWHADANVIYSRYMEDAEKIFSNTGCFSANYFSHKIHLYHLEKALSSKADAHFFLGPAICINRIELYRLFRKYQNNVFLHYRGDFDLQEGWDRKHFSLIYNKHDRDLDAIKIEKPHNEADPDSKKKFVIFRREEEHHWKKYFGGLDFKYYEDVTEKFRERIPLKTLDEIFGLLAEYSGNSYIGEQAYPVGRYKGFVVKENKTTRVATKEEINKFILNFK